MKAALLSLALIVAAFAAHAAAAAAPYKVFVFTNQVASGSVDEQLKARQESLQDLVKALSGPKYQHSLTIVKTKDAADVVVELTSRGESTTGASISSTRATAGATMSSSGSSSVTKQFLKLHVAAGRHVQDLTTEGQAPWPMMAERAADDLATWIGKTVTAAP